MPNQLLYSYVTIADSFDPVNTPNEKIDISTEYHYAFQMTNTLFPILVVS